MVDMTLAKTALSTILREYGQYVISADIKEKDGEFFILAHLNQHVDFFPDLIHGVSIEINNDPH